ncbi:MAG: acyl carrier protein [Oligoflexales bacterium]|nr:acyl carrier protein [Oligoflexales bacterium]
MLDEVRTGLLSILKEQGIPVPQQLSRESRLVEDLGLESIKALGLAVAIENHFKICLYEDAPMQNIGDIEDLICLRLQELRHHEQH